MDDQIRMEVARAVYGYPTLNKYAIDPAKPIRISVQNGHVELYGMVDSQADKETAYIRANGVPGVFSVKNYLQVAGQADGSAQVNRGVSSNRPGRTERFSRSRFRDLGMLEARLPLELDRRHRPRLGLAAK